MLALLTAGTSLGACPGTHFDPPPDPLVTAESVLALAETYLATSPGAAVIEGRASQYSDRGGLKGKVLLLLKRPGQLSLSGLSPTDDVVSVLVSDGARFTAYQRGAASCFVGRACPSNVGRFASIPLESDELVGVLLGRPPVIPHRVSPAPSMSWDRDVGAYRVELTGDSADLGLAHGRTQRLWVAHGDGRIVKTALFEDGKAKVEVTYSDFGTIGGKVMPRRLDIHMARESTDLRLDYRDLDLSPELEPGAFTFTCPSGTNLEELPCFEP